MNTEDVASVEDRISQAELMTEYNRQVFQSIKEELGRIKELGRDVPLQDKSLTAKDTAGSDTLEERFDQAVFVMQYNDQMILSLRKEVDRFNPAKDRRQDNQSYSYPPERPGTNPHQVKAQINVLETNIVQLQQAISRNEDDIRLLGPGNHALSNGQTEDLKTHLSHGDQIVLKSQLADCYTKLERMRSSISPIHSLPMDILGDIFSRCKDSGLCDASGPTLLSITHVCSFWRSFGISQPYLWTSISANLHDERQRPGWLSIIELWVSRAKVLPLDISLAQEIDRRRRGKPQSGLSQILDFLFSQSHRWKSVKIECPKIFLPYLKLWEKFSSINGSFDELESISWRSGGMEDSDFETIMEMFCRSSKLRVVNWKVQKDDFIVCFPWEQLTHLYLVDPLNIKRILGILSNTRKSLNVDLQLKLMTRISTRKKHRYNHVVNTNIQHLSLDGATGNLGILLDFLSIPNLAQLKLVDREVLIAHNGGDESRKSPSLLSFLHRSKCNLQHLSLTEVQLTSNDILSILTHTSPTLTHLRIHPSKNAQCITDEVLLSLTLPNSSPAGLNNMDRDDSRGAVNSLCPCLQHLELTRMMNTTDGLLSAMVKSRFVLDSQRKLLSGKFYIDAESIYDKDVENLVSLRCNHDLEGLVFRLIGTKT